MAKFLLGESNKTEVTVNRKSIPWSVDFTLPDEIRENMPVAEIRAIDGIFVMDFYADPMVGDTLTYKGHRWQVVGRDFPVTRHTKREPKTVPSLKVFYLGKAE